MSGSRRIALALSAVLVTAPGLVLAGCGGSSSANSTTTQSAGTGTTTSGSGGSSATGHRGKSHGHGATTGGSATGTTTAGKGSTGGSHHRGGRASAGVNTDIAGAKAQNPCKLVTKTEAQGIVGAALSSQKEAPLGPTCIFTFAGRRATITLAVEALNYRKTVAPMKKATKLTIDGRPAECGTLGTQQLFVSLTGGRKVMNVTASCPIAEAFARDALPRVHA